MAYAASMERTWGVFTDYRFTNDNAHISWHCQQDVRAQQQALMRPDLPELVQCFTDAFPRLSQLRAVRLAGCLDDVDSLGHQRLAPVHQQCYKHCESLSVEGLLVGADQLRNAFVCAKRSVTTRIEHLSAYELHPDLFEPQNDVFQSLCGGASSLKSLDIDFSLSKNRVYNDWFGRNYAEHNLLFECRGIKLFLDALPNLRSLRLWFGTINELRHCPKFEHVLGGVKLPMLQSLDIAKLQTRSKELLEFFSNHATCIRRVRLKDICLIDEKSPTCRSDVLDAMRCEVKLEAVVLSGSLETLSPRSWIDTNNMILQYSGITLNEILTGFLLEKDRADIFEKWIDTNPEANHLEKLGLVDLRVIKDSVTIFDCWRERISYFCQQHSF